MLATSIGISKYVWINIIFLGKALCQGNSGGALVMKQSGSKHYVKGIISNSLRIDDSCNI